MLYKVQRISSIRLQSVLKRGGVTPHIFNIGPSWLRVCRFRVQLLHVGGRALVLTEPIGNEDSWEKRNFRVSTGDWLPTPQS
jgi:hypothetical protein